MESLWQATDHPVVFPQLKKDATTDVLIVGGGMAGVLCAYMLQQQGANYMLVEADRVGRGVTKNTTAKITSQHGLIYDKLNSEFDEETAKQYLATNQAAIESYRTLCKNIDCDFEEKDAFVYSLNDRQALEKEVQLLKALGFDAALCEPTVLPFETMGAVNFPHQAQFNPLKFLSSIVQGLNIYEHTMVRKVEGTVALTEYGKIRANKIIIATHFPFINQHGFYFLKMYQHRSYVIALENAPDVHGMYVDEAQTGMSFRNYNNLLLIGGGDHRTGKKGGNWQELRDFAKKYYPNATEKYHWATQDCMTLDGMPYIGQYSGGTPNLYVATGFNKWGMSSSMVAATILSNMVKGIKTPYASAFSPSRTLLRPQLAVNAFEATVGLITPVGKRCPHLGCALKWNPYEHTWDCTCHGSRFTESGELIDNPATKSLNDK